MAEQTNSTENVIAVSFSEQANAYEALARLKALDAHGDVSVRAAAVVTRDDDGKIIEQDKFGHDGYEATATGGLVGLLIGVLGGPLGVLIGGASGLLVGSLFDEDESDETESALSDISKSIRPGPAGLLADLSEQSPVAVDAVVANLGGTIVRRSASDVELEIAAAEDAQRAAKQKARTELRESREKQRKEDVDAKLAELKAKLHHPMQAATPTS